MKGLRKILWVSWTAKKTNEWVLNSWSKEGTVRHRQTWASVHRGKWGQLTPWKNGRKIKRKRAKKSSDLNGGGVGGEVIRAVPD